MKAFAPGIYPRSEALVQATRDLDRRRTSPQAVDEQVRRDLDAFLSVQRQARLDLLSDGMLRWQDLFRPLLEASEGLETGALTRFLDTNTFYRAPHADSASPTLAAPLDERYVSPLPGPRLATLPSPFALSKGTRVTPEAIAENVLKPAIDAIEAELVVLAEPFLGRDDAASPAHLERPLEKLSGRARLALQLTFCDARRLFEQGLAELPVDAIGIDFYATHLTDVPKGIDKLLLAGVIDARSSTLEEPRELSEFAERLRSEREVAEIALVPNGDLQFVSEPIAREKLLRLGQAKSAFATSLRSAEGGFA
jgi:5-methyltetrahydropteroyltriglutamate--homocysteine methyltransferase